MAREINEEYIDKIPTVKITNEPFDAIIGHNECERKYFTIENNDVIYKRLREETSLKCNRPYLGPCVDFGMGDVVLEENSDCFKFYIIDRASKFKRAEFNNIEDAIEHLISFYTKYNEIDDPEKMREIFYQTLGLLKNKETKKH